MLPLKCPPSPFLLSLFCILLVLGCSNPEVPTREPTRERVKASTEPGPAEPPPKDDTFSFPDINLGMLWCKPGTFMMGSPRGETGRYSSDTQYEVTLTQGFYLGKHEVTQEQWEKGMGANPSNFKGATRWRRQRADCRKAMSTPCPRRRSGSMLVVQGPRLLIPLEIRLLQSRQIIMLVRRHRSALTLQMRGDSTTCTVMYLNGVWIGMGTIQVLQQEILPAHRMVQLGSAVAVAGLTTAGTCGRRTGPGVRRTPVAASWVSASVSRPKKKNGVTRREPEGPWRAGEVSLKVS